MPTNNAIIAEIDRMIAAETARYNTHTGLAQRYKTDSTMYYALASESMHAIIVLEDVRNFIQGKDKKNE